jgi:hypothetical protein
VRRIFATRNRFIAFDSARIREFAPLLEHQRGKATRD